MRTRMLMLMSVLACGLFAVAQSTDMSSGQNDHMSNKKMMGKKMSMTGCLSEKDGKFWLMNKKHPNGVEVMGSEDLKSHVGQKVEVKGSSMHNGMMSGDKMKDKGMSNSNDGMAKDGNMKKDDDMAKGDSMKKDDGMKKDDHAMDHSMDHSMNNSSGMMMNVTAVKKKSDTCDMSSMMK